jgi:hypothetical protein
MYVVVQQKLKRKFEARKMIYRKSLECCLLRCQSRYYQRQVPKAAVLLDHITGIAADGMIWMGISLEEEAAAGGAVPRTYRKRQV